MDEWRRSGQIPAFGNWEQANDLPITQYFESARQAGLIRYSTTNSSGECGHQYMRGDLYAPPRKTKTKAREKRGPHVKDKEQRKNGKVCDVTEPARKQPPTITNANANTKPPSVSMSIYSNSNSNSNNKLSNGHRTDNLVRPKIPKTVDEDLYKIPPELLRSSKRKKRAGLFSCLVPACAS